MRGRGTLLSLVIKYDITAKYYGFHTKLEILRKTIPSSRRISSAYEKR